MSALTSTSDVKFPPPPGSPIVVSTMQRYCFLAALKTAAAAVWSMAKSIGKAALISAQIWGEPAACPPVASALS
jgi:hypothetical protein